MTEIECYVNADGGVSLPTYAMVGRPRLEGVKWVVRVEVPDAYVGADGRLDEPAIRAIYKGQAKWDKAGVTDGVQV